MTAEVTSIASSISDIRSACPHPSFLSPVVLKSPVTNTFLYSMPSVYDTPSFEAAWLCVCTCMCMSVQMCVNVFVCVFTRPEQPSCGEYINVSVWHYQSSSTLSVKQIGHTWAGMIRTYVCLSAACSPLKAVCGPYKERESVWATRGESYESQADSDAPLLNKSHWKQQAGRWGEEKQMTCPSNETGP